MSRILRINGAIADIDSQTKINLSYKSPLFGDLQKITSNTSYTIKLPLTATNRALIKNVNIVGVESGFAYDYFRVDYEQDGLIVVDNGVGYLLSIGDQIEISVVFGGVSSFAKIKDAKLNEMPIPVEQGQIDWDGSQFAGIGTSADILFLQMDYGLGVLPYTDYAHPVVRVSKIINWINQTYGMKIAPIGKRLVVPCITKDCRENYRHPIEVLSILKEEAETNLGRIYLYPDIFNISSTAKGSFKLHNQNTANGDAVYNDDVKMSIEMVAIRADNGSVLVNVKPERIVVTIDGVQQWYAPEEGSTAALTVDIPRGKPFHFICQVPVISAYTQQYVGLRMKLNIADGEFLTRGEKFDTLYNLPKMKVIDFIKALMQIEGKFPRLTPVGIGWVSIDDLYSNISKAVDWSDKINKIVSVNFRIDGFAQNNKLTWAEDETVKLIDQGVLVVENKTIDVEKEMVKIPFAASDNNDAYYGSFAIVPIYTKEIDNDGIETINYGEVKPRIVQEMLGMAGIPCGQFTEQLHLSGNAGIVARCYSKYQQVIRQPRVVKCEALLTTQDIAELDMMRPVYVEQLNGYLAVLSVVTKENISDVELLKL